MATGLRINYPQQYETNSQNPFSSTPSNISAVVTSNSSGIHNDPYAPLFQRNNISDYAELQNCHAIIESLQQRIHHLEVINLNLEYRLEKEAKSNIELERECISIESNWSSKCDSLQKEIDVLKQTCETERIKNERLREHLSRTERELYSILQRKYELMRGVGGNNSNGKPGMGNDGSNSMRTGLSPSWETSVLKGSSDPSSGLDDMYGPQQVRPPKDLRQKKVLSNLAEFFGL